MEPFPWSLAEKAALSPERLVQAAASATARSEPQIQAWARLTLEAARARAEELADELRGPGPRSPLHGVPYGAKDIFDTAGVPTEWGSATQRGRTPDRDSDLVKKLHSLGCVLLGKTHTTAYAYYDTGPTRNPRDPARTPGGSSSGSAAAVAAGMVPFAIGSQTQGSVLRPASYCGIAGFKPTIGSLPLGGVMPFAPTLDHAGLFAPTAADIALIWTALGFGEGPDAAREVTVLEWPLRGSVEPAMAASFQAALGALEAGGMAVRRTPRPAFFDDLPPALRTVMACEAAREHGGRYRQHGPSMGAKLAALLEEGLRIPAPDYDAARRTIGEARAEFAAWAAAHPLIATPAALGPAPAGLESSGDPRCNAPFTALGAPAISIPMPAASPLPMGVQLATAAGADGLLLASAQLCERLLSPGAAGPREA